MFIILLVVVVTEKLKNQTFIVSPNGLSNWFINGRPRNPSVPRSPSRSTHSPVVPIDSGIDPTGEWDPHPLTSPPQSHPLSPYVDSTTPIGSQSDPRPLHAIALFVSITPAWGSPPPNPGTRQRAWSQFESTDGSEPWQVPSPPRSPTRPRVESLNDPITRCRSPRWRRWTKSRSPTRAGLRATPPTRQEGDLSWQKTRSDAHAKLVSMRHPILRTPDTSHSHRVVVMVGVERDVLFAVHIALSSPGCVPPYEPRGTDATVPCQPPDSALSVPSISPGSLAVIFFAALSASLGWLADIFVSVLALSPRPCVIVPHHPPIAPSLLPAIFFSVPSLSPGCFTAIFVSVLSSSLGWLVAIFVPVLSPSLGWLVAVFVAVLSLSLGWLSSVPAISPGFSPAIFFSVLSLSPGWLSSTPCFVPAFYVSLPVPSPPSLELVRHTSRTQRHVSLPSSFEVDRYTPDTQHWSAGSTPHASLQHASFLAIFFFAAHSLSPDSYPASVSQTLDVSQDPCRAS